MIEKAIRREGDEARAAMRRHLDELKARIWKASLRVDRSTAQELPAAEAALAELREKQRQLEAILENVNRRAGEAKV